MRHSFASYHLALHESADKTALEMGHRDTRMLFRHYREIVTKGEAVEYIPHQIDDNSGVGTQVAAGDVNGDGTLDIVVGNKKGAFVHLHTVKRVSQKEWQAAQPKKLK